MSWADLVLGLVKIVIVIAFLLCMAAISVWADRRQSAMVQDRIGPNRAVVYVPTTVMRLLVPLPAILVAAAISIPLWGPAPGLELARMTTGVEVAVLVGWFSLLLLAVHVRRNGAENVFDELVGRVDPRTYFYGGLVLHLVALPLVRVVPASLWRSGGVWWGPGLCGALAAVVIMASGVYAAMKLPKGKVAIRLAGTMHAVADAIKLIIKEDLRPKNADRLLFTLAPLMAMFPPLVTFAVVPFGSPLCFRDLNHNGSLDFAELGAMAVTVGRSGMCAAHELPVKLAVGDLNVGLLYVFAIAGTGVIAAAIAGWASDNKYALLGGLRATSQMISYEVAMGLAITGMLMVAGTVHMQKLVDWQGENAWGIFVQPLGFLLFFVALVAETKRVPFDQPEGESEIVAGYFIEYSCMKFGLFFLGEFAEFAFSSALLVTLFFGGYHLPFLYADGIHVTLGATTLFDLPMSHLAVSALHVVAFFGKTVLLTWLQVFVRWTLPRFRYDQVMKLGWTRLLPLALANILLTGLVMLAIEAGGKPVAGAFTVAGQLAQALVAVGGVVAAVATVTWLLEPSSRRRLILSTTARRVAAAGGIKAGEMQA
jgi:NADH-quinone oxidoreductase subunit H